MTNPDPTLAERLLANCLQRPASQREAAIDRACEQHPEQAAMLRKLFRVLGDVGLSGPAGDFPETLGEFRLIERLGGGGMGVVYLAEQASLGRRVALKLIRPDQLFFPGARERFEREAEAIARLKHPGIVPVYAAGEQDGVPYLAMEWVEGRPLGDAIRDLREHRPESLTGGDLGRVIGADADVLLFEGNWVDTCLRVVARVADAVDHAHAHGVIHRDIKPSNIMLTRDGRVLLLDFGLAWSAEARDLTQTGSQPGSLLYMAPEQLDSGRADERSDVYSLGVTLYECLTLAPPFPAKTAETTRKLILTGSCPPLRQRNRAIRWEVDTVCRTAMALASQDRYASAADFGTDLHNTLALRPIVARPAPLHRRVLRWAQRRPAVAAALMLGFLLLVPTPTFLLLQQTRARRRIQAEKQSADESFELAYAAVDRMLTEVASRKLSYATRLEPTRARLLQQALSFYEMLHQRRPSDTRLPERIAFAQQALARSNLRAGNLPESHRLFRLAYTYYRDRVRHNPDEIDARVLEIECYSPLVGSSPEFTCEQELAKIDAALSRDPDQGELVLAWARTTVSRALDALTAGRMKTGGKLLQQALAKLDELVGRFPKDARIHLDRARARHRLAQYYLGAKGTRQFGKWIELALEDIEAVTRLSPEPETALSYKVRILETKAIAYSQIGRHDQVEKTCREAIALNDHIVHYFPVTEGRLVRLSLYNVLAFSYLRTHRNHEAEECLRKVIARGEELLAESPRAVVKRRLLSAYRYLGYLLRHKPDPPAALEVLTKGLKLGTEMLANGPRNTTLDLAIGDIRLSLGYLAVSGGDARLAIEHMRAAEDCYVHAIRLRPVVLGPRGTFAEAARVLADVLVHEAGPEAAARQLEADVKAATEIESWIPADQRPTKLRAELAIRAAVVDGMSHHLSRALDLVEASLAGTRRHAGTPEIKPLLRHHPLFGIARALAGKPDVSLAWRCVGLLGKLYAAGIAKDRCVSAITSLVSSLEEQQGAEFAIPKELSPLSQEPELRAIFQNRK